MCDSGQMIQKAIGQANKTLHYIFSPWSSIRPKITPLGHLTVPQVDN